MTTLKELEIIVNDLIKESYCDLCIKCMGVGYVFDIDKWALVKCEVCGGKTGAVIAD